MNFRWNNSGEVVLDGTGCACSVAEKDPRRIHRERHMQFNWKNTRNFKLSSVFLKTLPRWTIQNKRSSIISPSKHQNLHLENNHILQKFPTSKTSPNFLQGCTEFTSNNTARSQTCTENEIYFQTQKNTTTYLKHPSDQSNKSSNPWFVYMPKSKKGKWISLQKFNCPKTLWKPLKPFA